MQESIEQSREAVLGGRVVRDRLPVYEGRPAPGAVLPDLKRLLLPQGELAQIHNGGSAIRYLAWIALQDGGVRGNHVHRRKDESIYLIAGGLRLVVEDPGTGERAELMLKAGDRVHIPPGIAHALQPVGDGHALEFAPDPLDPTDTFPHRLI